MPGLDPRRADSAGSGFVPRPGAARGHAWDSGMAELLLQVTDDRAGLYPEHDLFIQSMKLKNTLRWMMGEDLITHLGQEYYD